MQFLLLNVAHQKLRWLNPMGIPYVEECIHISRVFPTMSFFIRRICDLQEISNQDGRFGCSFKDFFRLAAN